MVRWIKSIEVGRKIKNNSPGPDEECPYYSGNPGQWFSTDQSDEVFCVIEVRQSLQATEWDIQAHQFLADGIKKGVLQPGKFFKFGRVEHGLVHPDQVYSPIRGGSEDDGVALEHGNSPLERGDRQFGAIIPDRNDLAVAHGHHVGKCIGESLRKGISPLPGFVDPHHIYTACFRDLPRLGNQLVHEQLISDLVMVREKGLSFPLPSGRKGKHHKRGVRTG